MTHLVFKFLTRKALLLGPSLLFLSACAGNGEGLDVGGRPIPPGPPPNGDFAEIQTTIFTPICSVCHTGGGAPEGLRFDAGVSYGLIVNVPSSQVPSLMRVNPGNPDQSYIVQKIQGNASGGVRMPYGGPYLSQAQIDLIRRWIAAGAPQAAAPPEQLVVANSIPTFGEDAAPGTDKITVFFNSQVDSSLVGADTFQLSDALDQPVAIASAVVPLDRPTVVELTMAQPLSAGSYQLAVRGGGGGAVSLADNAGHLLDGDVDGTPGGDALIHFDVNNHAGEIQ